MIRRGLRTPRQESWYTPPARSDPLLSALSPLNFRRYGRLVFFAGRSKSSYLSSAEPLDLKVPADGGVVILSVAAVDCFRAPSAACGLRLSLCMLRVAGCWYGSAENQLGRTVIFVWKPGDHVLLSPRAPGPPARAAPRHTLLWPLPCRSPGLCGSLWWRLAKRPPEIEAGCTMTALTCKCANVDTLPTLGCLTFCSRCVASSLLPPAAGGGDTAAAAAAAFCAWSTAAAVMLTLGRLSSHQAVRLGSHLRSCLLPPPPQSCCSKAVPCVWSIAFAGRAGICVSCRNRFLPSSPAVRNSEMAESYATSRHIFQQRNTVRMLLCSLGARLTSNSRQCWPTSGTLECIANGKPSRWQDHQRGQTHGGIKRLSGNGGGIDRS